LKKKVLFITNILPPYRVDLFNLLSRNSNYEFLFLFESKSEPNRKWKVSDREVDFKYKILPSVNISKINFKKGLDYTTKSYIHINYSIVFEILKFRPNILITSAFGLNSIISILIKKLLHIPNIVWSEETKHTAIMWGKNRNRVRRYIAKNTDAFIVSGKLARKYIYSLNDDANNVFIAIDSLSYKGFEKIGRKKDIKKKYHIKAGCVNILVVSELTERKGIENFLKIVIELRKVNDKFNLIIVGDGEEEVNLVDFVSRNDLRNIYFLGHKDREELKEIYFISDFFVFPTFYDHWGFVVNEAMSAGLPVICSKYAGCSDDLVIDNYNGYIVDPNNYKNVVSKMLCLLEDKKKRKEMGKNSLKLIKKTSVGECYKGFISALDYLSK